MTGPHTTVHKDATVTYWSVYEQVWHRRAEVVPDRELAAMTSSERDRIARALTDERDRLRALWAKLDAESGYTR